MRRIAIGLEYEGTSYHGWQIQAIEPTVQSVLESALSRVANDPIHTFCAGRTDAGVHAVGQIAHFDTSALRSERAWVLGTNTYLPKDIRVLWARLVPTHFHARFSALNRRYRYILSTQPCSIMRHAICFWPRNINGSAMQEGARYLLGMHDFSSFRSAGCQAHSPIRTILHLQVHVQESIFILDITANAFLMHMIRNIMGALIVVGQNQKPPIWINELLKEKNRCALCLSLPPHGLHLMNVQYPKQFAIPETKTMPCILH